MLAQAFQLLEESYQEMVEIRRDLHRNPELSFQEVRTSRLIADYLRDLGLAVRTEVGGRGVVARLPGRKRHKTVALRADFDALPIQDEKNVPYKSTVPGVMHACGHDVHTAALLVTAKVLTGMQEHLKGDIVFVFQHAEEQVPGGARAMIEDDCLEGVDVIYGAHVASIAPLGMVGIRSGSTTAAADEFEIVIGGKGGHGAFPHTSVDPLVTACQLVVSLQQIVSRRVDPLKAAVLTVGTFQAGSAPNVIPDTAKITGTVRTFDEEVRELMEQTIRQVATCTAEGAGAAATISYTRGYPSVWNDPCEASRVESVAAQVFGKEKILPIEPLMGAEDFSYYLQRVPGCFFYVGGGNKEIGATYPHHHPLFDVDERSMLYIGKLFVSLVSHCLSE
ncbi:amidohydrolase [Brevibacillus borstelensis]|uniref:M20 metallopeptidase family protein n=1 Tax=Brevibacillus borstelensis TaxID=45462 RepID=UPI0030C59DBE